MFAVGEDLAEVLRAEHIAQRGGGEEAGRPVGVLHVRHRHRRVLDAVVHDGVHGHGHRVLRQDLRKTGSDRFNEVLKGFFGTRKGLFRVFN